MVIKANKSQVESYDDLKDLGWQPEYIGNPNDRSDSERFKKSFHENRVFLELTDLKEAKALYKKMHDRNLVAYRSWEIRSEYWINRDSFVSKKKNASI